MVGARRARMRRASPTPCFVNSEALKEDMARIRRQREAALARKKREHALNALFERHDVDRSGKLDQAELRKLLAEYTPVFTEGTPRVSDEEVDFVMKVADASGTGDGCLDRSELPEALKAWATYVPVRLEMEEALQKFDTSGTGKLEQDELKAYFRSLDEGCDIADQQVAQVLAQADVFGDGALRATELPLAVNLWRRHAEQRDARAGCHGGCRLLEGLRKALGA